MSSPFNFGFIITRHVNCEKTNKYWNQNVRLLNQIYPIRQIVIIDDNSNPNFVKSEYEHKNLTVIQSEYPGRGELLPYIYFYRYKWFDGAVILHDSTFFHRVIPFGYLNVPVMPLWHFSGANLDNKHNNLRICSVLNHSNMLNPYLNTINPQFAKKWNGCFGIQSYIRLPFLTYIMEKYNIGNLVNVVRNRTDRCSLERIFGLIFSLEFRVLPKIKSALGDIFMHTPGWGYNYDEYIQQIEKDGRINTTTGVVKVWTGR